MGMASLLFEGFANTPSAHAEPWKDVSDSVAGRGDGSARKKNLAGPPETSLAELRMFKWYHPMVLCDMLARDVADVLWKMIR